MDWLTGGQRYQVTDENNPCNVLPQINEQFAANRSNMIADPRVLRQALSREQQSVARAVLRALHEGLQGLGLRNRLMNELGQGSIAKNRALIEGLISANEGKAGVYLVDPLACWPNCGDVVQDLNTANPLRSLISFVKASDACMGCGQRKGTRCASCHMDLIMPNQDLPKGSFKRVVQVLTAASLTPDRVRVAASSIEAVDGFSERESIELLVKDLAVSRVAAPTTTRIETSGINMTGESDLVVDVLDRTGSKDSDGLVDISASSLDESVMSSCPPNILNMDANLGDAGDDECSEGEVDVDLTPRHKVDGISVVLDDNLDVTL
jgi:hypothetical protein